MKPTAPPPPPCCSLFLAPHTRHLCMFLGFLCAQASENSPQIQVVAVYTSILNNFFLRQPLSLHKTGGLSDDLSRTTCLTTAACLEAYWHPMSMDSPLS